MIYFLALVSLIPIILLGDLAFQQLGRPIQISAPFAQRLALDWALGTGMLTLILFYSSLIKTGYGYSISIVLVSVLALFQLVRILKNSSNSWDRLASHTRKNGLKIMLAMIAIGALWTVSAATGLGLDGTAHWGIKAKASFLEGGWQLLPPGLSRFPHHNYPLLIPTLQGWIYTIIGVVDPEAVKIVFVSFYLALGSLFYHAIRPFYSPLLTLLYTLLVMTTPLLAISFLPAYADVPLMLFIFGAAIMIGRWLKLGDRTNMVVGATLAAFALLVKMEGMIYWLVTFVFIMCYAVYTYWRKRSTKVSRQAILFPLITLLVAGSWFLYTWQADLTVRNFASPSLAFVLANSDRIPVILFRLMRSLFLDVGYWGLLWPLFVLVTIWKWRSLLRAGALYLWVSVVGPIIILSLGFIFSLWDSYVLHVDTALFRIVLHTVPIAWLFIATQSSEVDDWFQRLLTPPELEIGSTSSDDKRNKSPRGEIDLI